MIYRPERTARFKRQFRKLVKRGYDPKLLEEVVVLLSNGVPLPRKYRDHQLKGDLRDYRECHIAPDWLLVYKIDKDVLVLVLHRTGTHSDLF